MRRSLTPEQKQARKDSKNADKAQALADNALAKLPAEKERRLELFQEADAIKTEAQGLAGTMSAHKKRMQDVFGITKAAMKIRAILASCKSGEYEATVEQTKLFMEDMDRPFQLSMFTSRPGQGVAEDEGSVFDKTASGKRNTAERLDDPGRARKRKTDTAPPAAPSPGLTTAEAEAAFKATAHKAPKPKSDPPAAPSDDDEDLRPRFLRANESTSIGASEGQGTYKIQ